MATHSLAAALRNRGTRFGRGVAERESSVLRTHGSGFRTQDKRGTGCDWGAAAVRYVVLPGCVSLQLSSSARIRGREYQRSAQAGDACFFTVTADRRAREMTRLSAAETKQRQAYPLSYPLSRSSGGLKRSLPQDGSPSGGLRMLIE
jgi:hypothetical protein